MSSVANTRRALYLAAHPICEYTLAAAGQFDFHRWAGITGPCRKDPNRATATEVDHIFGRRGRANDVEHPSNYFATARIPHQWKTDNDRDGRILAIWWKWRQGGVGWDPQRMSDVFGQNILGWLANKTTELEPWLVRRAAQVLEALDYDKQSRKGESGGT